MFTVDVKQQCNAIAQNFYQAMPLEMVSEDVWLHTDAGSDNNI